MSVLKSLLLACCILLGTQSFAQENLKQNISVHDPVMIKQGGTYYLFCTGFGISKWSSKDLINWKRDKPVFSTAPQWAVDTIPNFKGHIWAPDISYYKGKYYLYYSVSAFGKNTSAIGVATNTTLNEADPNYKWVDHGRVVQSYPNVTNWNAIDPNLIADEKGNAYLTWGSFWDGLKIAKLSEDRLSLTGSDKDFATIASRKKVKSEINPPAIDDNPKDAGGNAIEAPFIYKKGNYYYLFASIDYCCKGERSTYKMIVGRSKNILGPYLDDKGVDMARAGGKMLLQGNEKWHGVGHNAVVDISGEDYLVYHAYDAEDKGIPKLQIKKLAWEQGWPEVK
ncbi:ABC transporter substrate-binding protein [Pelobium manganitolerans]|uniref:ABC transporter substrate-binding protein n=1 Tax=Pelobium manganitolerans TaxID=1842495 RepID=A0A419S5P0_9SPHI|nr:family 43 glycosylhydrolase [Pelobium manganitolerans]RKD16162.1 ABC transporter substrate-binding protein [Pelobium manganitolerans]